MDTHVTDDAGVEGSACRIADTGVEVVVVVVVVAAGS